MRARLPRSIRHTETLASTHVCAGVKPPPDGYGEGQGGLPYPISEGGDTPPRPATGNTSGSGPGELQYLIRGGGVDSVMFPAPTQGGWTHLSPRGTLQKVVEGGVPQEKNRRPPTYREMDVSGRYFTSYVAQGGYPTGDRMYVPGPNSQRYHQHTGHMTSRYPVEGGGGAYRHPPTRKPPVGGSLRLDTYPNPA